MDTYSDLILLIILILLSGVFSASETALTSFRSIHLEEISSESHKKGELLKLWLKKPTEMLTALLLGNNIVNIFATSLATSVITNFLASQGKENSQGMSVIISSSIMTVIILIFGEITPKIIAKNNSTSISKKIIIPIYLFTKIAKPIIFILMVISKFINRILGIEIDENPILMTEKDIISYINVGTAEGVIEHEEKNMIESIVNFGETVAREIMTPRTSLFALNGNSQIKDILSEVIENGYSRIPVYDDGIDDILGILYIKDLLLAIKENKLESPIRDFIREASFIPETKSILKVLEDFKKDHVHIAIVIDEYGGTVGVTTIEDVIEEIFGEIRDEYDTEEVDLIKEVSEKVFEVDGMIDIETLNKELNILLPASDDYESLGGLILNELNEIAEVGDIVTIEEIELSVLEVDKKRIAKVLLTKKG